MIELDLRCNSGLAGNGQTALLIYWLFLQFFMVAGSRVKFLTVTILFGVLFLFVVKAKKEGHFRGRFSLGIAG
ncbi:hypothetical protein [Microbulbifer sp. GL-2]|uniref:hypothetical protein n=1 Tax=Microbulbifer sp. GL-2 TaxID=2591606 RepID=UPI00117BFC27|nr:hypothetical protein [Microbulbifer sp. GL-2]